MYLSNTLLLNHVSFVVPTVISVIMISTCLLSQQIESNIVRCPDPEYADKMIAAIDTVRVRGDSVGGVVTCIVKNAPRVCSLTQ